jgi:fimbrial chaperone protein
MAMVAGLKRFAKLLAMAIVVAAAFAQPAQAMRVSPMVVEMATGGANSSARIEVQNVGGGLLAFETRITRIDFDDQGQPTEVPADDDFLVFPPQGALQPDARQVIRLQWLGPPDLAVSQSYYLSVNQLPVELTPGEDAGDAAAQVQIVYHMKALITVAPPEAEPDVSVVSVEAGMVQPPAPAGADPQAPLPPKAPGVVVHLRNTGNRYAMLAGANWVLEGRDRNGEPLRVVLDREQLSRMIGVGYLAPVKGDRTFQLVLDQNFADGPLRLRFTQ